MNMNGPIAKREAQWDAFLQRWPLEKLADMTLPQYSKAGDPDCFVYWLEAKTEMLGSIWGGSSFKFGVYSRDDKTAKSAESGRLYSTDYAWYAKYGDSSEQAFARVKAQIIQVAEAARAGQLERVDQADLGQAVKWKIAFLYQDRKAPCIVPIYKLEYLQVALDSTGKQVAALQRELMKAIGGKSILEYGDEVWATVGARIRTELTPEEAKTFFEQLDRFSPIKQETQKMAGFRTRGGNELALALDNKKTTLYLREGTWLAAVESQLLDIVHYASDKSRSSNLAANAPQLAVGNPIVKVVVPTKAALIALCDSYDDADPSPGKTSPAKMTTSNISMLPRNQILFGPPGTGKTYATIEAALAIVAPDYLASHPEIPGADWAAQQERRRTLKRRFDELSQPDVGRIRFVTFHQSFSYEDFVEGLRAQTNAEDQLEYVVEDGVFKQVCDAARTYATRQSRPEIKGNPRIWKISIDGTTKTSTTREYCLTHGEARIGWGDTGDLRDPPNDYLRSLGTNDKSTLGAFGAEIAEGDILVCIRSAQEIGAVGVVSGPYRFDDKPPEGVYENYKHVLPVDWLYRDLAVSILPLNDNKPFTAKTVYPLTRFTWGDLLAHLEKAGSLPPLVATRSGANSEPHVLVIDEINRGNISRIFGELITLIEPGKREGQLEALSAQLPYSKRPFSVPDNVYLIGTMNTADRSLAGLDIALRRRFSFVEMPPRPDLLEKIVVTGVNIGHLLQVMNERIELLLDRDHCLGHAYFTSLLENPSVDELGRIFKTNILPLLQEYFFEDWQRIQWVLNDHRKQAQHRFVRQPRNDLATLFGEGVNVNEQSRRWTINNEAFGLPEAYTGVISAKGAVEE